MNLTKKEFTALQHLSKRRDIIIKKVDKGNCIVVEDTETYIANGENHLSDERTYTRLENDPTETVAEQSGNTWMKQLKQAKSTSSRSY